MEARGDAVIFDESMGNVVLVSHQWVAGNHPDPEFEQMRVLQDVLGRLLYRRGSVSLDWVTESNVPGARAVSHEEFQARPLLIWYDYFSVPQAASCCNEQFEAISSIPAYVAKCRFFFALCPTIACAAYGKVLSAASWNTRGWCRLERAARELSAHDSWILVRSSTSVQVVGTAVSSVCGSVGEGAFTVAGDRQKLAPVMKSILAKKLQLSLKAGDLPAYRRHFCLQTVHLRGLEMEPVPGLMPDNETTPPEDDPASIFLYQTGLEDVKKKDTAGFWPLHYAALSGNRPVVEGLLAQHADPNRRTAKQEPKLGFPPWMSVLDLAIFYKHNDVARLLISARARLEGGVFPSMQWAAFSNNAEGLSLLQAAGGNPRAQNIFGASPFETAAVYGGREALEELLPQAQHSPLELGRALHGAMGGFTASAELVKRLISLRAEVNFQRDVRRDNSSFCWWFVAAQSLKHRVGRTSSALTSIMYHFHGQTPLAAAMQAAQHEGAAALIAAGARLDLRNGRNWTVADFAREQDIPSFLRQGLEGDPTECRRVAALALPDGYVEVLF